MNAGAMHAKIWNAPSRTNVTANIQLQLIFSPVVKILKINTSGTFKSCSKELYPTCIEILDCEEIGRAHV